MRDLDLWERAQCQIMTNQFAKSLKTRKKKTDEADKQAGLTFSGVVNFSDTGNDNQADFGQPERTETAFNDIKRLTVVHSVKDSIKQFLTQRNSVIKRNKERKAEADKLHKNGY